MAEIKRTVLLNKHPQGSRIRGIEINDELILKIVQLIKIKKLLENKYRDKSNGIGNKDHKSLLALTEKKDMIKSTGLYISETTIQRFKIKLF